MTSLVMTSRGAKNIISIIQLASADWKTTCIYAGETGEAGILIQILIITGASSLKKGGRERQKEREPVYNRRMNYTAGLLMGANVGLRERSDRRPSEPLLYGILSDDNDIKHYHASMFLA